MVTAKSESQNVLSRVLAYELFLNIWSVTTNLSRVNYTKLYIHCVQTNLITVNAILDIPGYNYIIRFRRGGVYFREALNIE